MKSQAEGRRSDALPQRARITVGGVCRELGGRWAADLDFLLRTLATRPANAQF